MLTQILEYQEKEGKLIKLEAELNNNAAKTLLAKMVATVKNEQNFLLELESQAKKICDSFEKSKIEYEKTAESLEKLVSTSIEDKEEKQLNDLSKKIEDMNNKLTSLGRSISQLSMQSAQVLKEFEKTKKNIIDSKEKHKKAKAEYDSVVASLEPQIASLKAELAKLEKQIDPKVFAKYKHSRQDGIFPVLVPLQNNSCGGCRMSLSAAYISKLKEQGFVECEQCRRMIYLK